MLHIPTASPPPQTQHLLLWEGEPCDTESSQIPTFGQQKENLNQPLPGTHEGKG